MNKSPNISHSRLVDKIKFLKAMKEADESMPVSQILYLLGAAEHPESGMKQIAKYMELPESSASRYLTLLSVGRPALGIEGLHLLQQEENPTDRKSKIITLTPEGQEFLARII